MTAPGATPNRAARVPEDLCRIPADRIADTLGAMLQEA